ncbi:hypothetical protein ACH5RR_027053 [Cinchona calisaya]|uniref:Uncharacterized protein n=1 Tax=Cinchona calisaya TaxID=153742 RepID=A0ABD2Z4B7_9GENT
MTIRANWNRDPTKSETLNTPGRPALQTVVGGSSFCPLGSPLNFLFLLFGLYIVRNSDERKIGRFQRRPTTGTSTTLKLQIQLSFSCVYQTVVPSSSFLQVCF